MKRLLQPGLANIFLQYSMSLRDLSHKTARIKHNRFTPCLPPGKLAGTATLGGLEIPQSFQQPVIVPLAPHQNGTKQGRRLTDATWSMDEISAAFPGMWPARLLANLSWVILVTWSNQQSWDLPIRRSDRTFRQGFVNFTA